MKGQAPSSSTEDAFDELPGMDTSKTLCDPNLQGTRLASSRLHSFINQVVNAIDTQQIPF